MSLLWLLLLPWVRSDLGTCTSELIQVVSNFATLLPEDKYQLMASYSGKAINDLGDYYSCCALADAEYAVFVVSIPPSAGYFTLCGPQICTADDYLQILANVTALMDPAHPLAQFNANIQALERLSHVLGSQTGRQLQGIGSELQVVFPQTYIHDNFTNLRTGAIVMLVFCVFLLLIVSIGTAIDLFHVYIRSKVTSNTEENYQKLPNTEMHRLSLNSQTLKDPLPPKPPSFLEGFFLCFSLYSNVPKLFSSRSAEKVGEKRDTLEILNAVRVMSMGWVILGHTYVYRFLVGAVRNPAQFATYMKDSKTAIIYAGLFSVDSFFWLGGFLMAFLLLQQLNSPKSLKSWGWGYLYLHRFYRILPAYMFVLFLTWAFTKYTGNGPLWYQGDTINTQCKDYWWTNLLFLNNFIPHGDGSGCLGQSWYLANDMQFFLISPPIFFLYHRFSRLLGWVFIAILCLLAVLYGSILSRTHDYSVVFIAPVNTANDFMGDYYIKPYARVAPYAVGVACGMVLYSYRWYKKTGEVYDRIALFFALAMDRRGVRYAAYGLGLFLVNFFIFIQYSAYKDVDHNWSNWNHTETDLFIGFNRFFWAVGISLLLVPLLQGHNPVFIWFLSLNFWAPLARLTFCTYLIHLHLIFILYLSQNEAYWFNDLNITTSLMFVTVLSYAAAIPLTLCVESPFMAFEKLMKSRKRREK